VLAGERLANDRRLNLLDFQLFGGKPGQAHL
jgi:hypothetical protein